MGEFPSKHNLYSFGIQFAVKVSRSGGIINFDPIQTNLEMAKKRVFVHIKKKKLLLVDVLFNDEFNYWTEKKKNKC